MRSVQEIFNHIIQDGKHFHIGNRYMCIALDLTKKDGSISMAECSRCIEEIEKFIHPYSTLASYADYRSAFCPGREEWFYNATVEEIFDHCKMVYQNWAHRDEFIIPEKFRIY